MMFKYHVQLYENLLKEQLHKMGNFPEVQIKEKTEFLKTKQSFL